MLKYYWYISTFLRKHGRLILLSVVVAIILFTVFFPIVSRFFFFQKRTYIGVVGKYTFSSLPRNIQEQISHGLTKLQADGSAIPDLAERWTVEDDGKTYRFVIKKKVFWQDGKELFPSDINYQFNDVETITTANDVIFKLKKDAFSPFPSVVSQPLFRNATQRYWLFFTRPKIIGIGEFSVSSFTERNQRLTELVLSSKTEEKIYRFYLTEEDAIAAFKRGEIDVLPDLSSAAAFENWNNVSINPRLDTQKYLGIFFNSNLPLFSSNEPKLRQALNYALPKPTDDTRAVGPISPKSWAFANVGKTYDFDEERAFELLFSELPHEPITFDLTTTPTYSDEAESIKKTWENFGQRASEKCKGDSDIKDKSLCDNLKITINLRITNFPDTSDFQALLIGQEIPADPDQFYLWHSGQRTNFTHYKNVRIDSLLEKGRQEIDQNKRTEIYHDFQQFFSEDSPVIFLRYLTTYDAHRKGK
jgi:peptide/nickel transport system substrate-binding protein